jgi:uncharacterized membrane protein YjjP (DUF1212 family)
MINAFQAFFSRNRIDRLQRENDEISKRIKHLLEIQANNRQLIEIERRQLQYLGSMA